MKKLLCLSLLIAGFLTSILAYADLTLSVAPTVRAPVKFTIVVSGKNVKPVRLAPLVIKPGDEETVRFRDHRAELIHFIGTGSANVAVTANKSSIHLIGTPGASSTVIYTQQGLKVK